MEKIPHGFVLNGKIYAYDSEPEARIAATLCGLNPVIAVPIALFSVA